MALHGAGYDPSMVTTEAPTDPLSPTTMVFNYLKSKGIPLTAGNISQALRDHAGDPATFAAVPANKGQSGEFDQAGMEPDRGGAAAVVAKGSGAPQSSAPPTEALPTPPVPPEQAGPPASAAAPNATPLSQMIMANLPFALAGGLPFMGGKGPTMTMAPQDVQRLTQSQPQLTGPPQQGALESAMQKALSGPGSPVGLPAPQDAALLGAPAAAALPGPRVAQAGPEAIPLPGPERPMANPDEAIPLPKPTVRVQAGNAPLDNALDKAVPAETAPAPRVRARAPRTRVRVPG